VKKQFPLIVGLALIVTGCSEQVVPKGWSPRQQCENGHCWDIGAEPNEGKWLTFHVGMSRDDAIGAACRASKNDNVTFNGEYPVSLDKGECRIAADAHDSSWAKYTLWSAKAPGFWCLPFGETQNLYFDFIQDRLVRISAYCPSWAL
jgi:hypothetical protein